MRRLLLLPLAVVLLTGFSWPTAEKFRQRPGNKVDTFEVARPIKDVSATLQEKSQECLNVRITYGWGKGITYKPTFIKHADRSELHVQRKADIYEIVLDATRVSATRSKIVVYRKDNSRSAMTLRNAVIHWAKGDNLGCPML